MNSRTCWMLVVFLAIFVDNGMAWRRRRRRRRAPPPPPPNCGVSAWSSWSTCSRFCSVGTQSRTRYVTYRPSASCIQPSLTESRQCGVTNAGCAHNCDNANHVCICRAGYKLMTDGKGCQVINKCSPNDASTCTPPRIRSSNFKCVCPKGFTGPNCERYSNICNTTTCGTFQVCVSHVEWVLKCISPSNQIPVLLRQSYMTVSVPENQYKIEAYVESILEGTRPAGQTLSSIFANNVINKRHCYLPPKNFYAEIATSRSVSTYTQAIFVIMNPKSNYTAFPRTKICQKLIGTDVRCFTEADCKLLERQGVNCLLKFDGGGGSRSGSGKSKGMSWFSSLGLGIASVIVLVIVYKVFMNWERFNRVGAS